MKAICLSDEQGRILSISLLNESGKEPSGITGGGIVPEDGHYVCQLDLPAEVEKKTLPDIQQEYRIDMGKGAPRLVHVKSFKEPYRK
ncbi:hypothetical protein [Desmospora profundinema]|uniref:Uncharacterized protein n=1 Tax=Desmospora profundinema TaxID=1571184 RepID=A0ABU1ILM5_9BACL|nr:hypothetical protein [Desmospora profundinema]MDR6225677.1 hypothetical protein [Desmospora profundinema]